MQDIVVGVDASTQSVKAVAWSREGRALAEGRSPFTLLQPEPDHAEQNPEDWWSAAVTALRELSTHVNPQRIAGLAIANQRETVAFLDAELRPVRSAIVWLDGRAKDEVGRLSQMLGAERLHSITGKPVDITPVIYRLAWMRRHQPEILERTALILDVHGYLTGRLTGQAVASWTSADPFGIFDIGRMDWSGPLLAAIGVRREQFPPVVRPGAAVGRLTRAAAEATGLAEGTPVFAGGGDGQCAGLGVNGCRPGQIYLNLGTAIITGAWSQVPRISLNWRTMTSPTGEGYFLEGCQRAGTFLVDWILDTFGGGRSPETFARLEREVATLPIGSQGLTVCPYLSGVMDPHWDPAARAAIEGLAPYHTFVHLYRAVLEALVLESSRTVEAMRREGLAPERIVAVGGGARSVPWTQMFADATGLPLVQSESVEASALGAGMIAATGAGWFDSAVAAAAAMSRTGRVAIPDPAARKAWQTLSERQARAYRPSRAA
jgi:xylulokinase